MAEKELDIIIRAMAQQTAEIAAVRSQVESLNTSVVGSAAAHEKHAVAANTAAKEERDLSREAAISARAMGQMGAEGGELAERFTNLTTAAGGLQGTLMGVGILGLGAVVEGTKAAIEQGEKHERALKDQEQAYKTAGQGVETYRSEIQDFLNTNRQFIADQDQAIEGFAMMTRAGLDQDMVLKAMNVSLDLASLKHITLEDAERRVLLGLEGNARGLKELGIQLKTIQNEDDNTAKAAKNLEEANKRVEEATRVHEVAVRHLEEAQVALTDKGHKPSHEQLMKLEDEQKKVKDTSDALSQAQEAQRKAHDATAHSIDTQNKTLLELKEKTDDGRQSVTNLERSQNDLNRAMQDFGNRVGPVMAESLAQDIEGVLHFGDALGGATSKIWEFISAHTAMSQVAAGRSARYGDGGSISFPTGAYYGRGGSGGI